MRRRRLTQPGVLSVGKRSFRTADLGVRPSKPSLPRYGRISRPSVRKDLGRIVRNLRDMAAQRTSRQGRTTAQRSTKPTADVGQLTFPLFDTPGIDVAPSDDEEPATAHPLQPARAPTRPAPADDLRSPHDRALVARIAAAERWARTADRAAATAPARRGLAARFEREADPDGVLGPEERARRADLLMRAHMLRMARRSARARRRTT